MLIAIRFSILMFILCGLIYPLAITGIGQLIFPWQANGSLLYNERHQPIASSLIGQKFTSEHYFHARPSVNGYDASNSGGSNLGATSKKLIERIIQDAKHYQVENNVKDTIPFDAVTTSASGLDPHISLKNAILQIPRIAASRHIDSRQLNQLVAENSTKQCHFFTRISDTCDTVDVLQLNLSLDRLTSQHRT